MSIQTFRMLRKSANMKTVLGAFEERRCGHSCFEQQLIIHFWNSRKKHCCKLLDKTSLPPSLFPLKNAPKVSFQLHTVNLVNSQAC